MPLNGNRLLRRLEHRAYLRHARRSRIPALVGIAPALPCPGSSMADYTHTIDRWDEATGETLIERIAGVGDYQVALETYRAAAKALARRQDHAARWALGWAD
jgi:hypothetical protein